MDGWIDKWTGEQINELGQLKQEDVMCKDDAQINPSNIFWKKRKLLLTLTSGLMQNLLVEFHTSLEHTFHPITPRSQAHPLTLEFTLAKKDIISATIRHWL